MDAPAVVEPPPRERQLWASQFTSVEKLIFPSQIKSWQEFAFFPLSQEQIILPQKNQKIKTLRNNTKKTTQFKNEQRIGTDIFPGKMYRWPVSPRKDQSLSVIRETHTKTTRDTVWHVGELRQEHPVAQVLVRIGRAGSSISCWQDWEEGRCLDECQSL